MEATNETIRCTEVTEEEIPKSLLDLAEFVTEAHEQNVRQINMCLEEVVRAIRKYIAIGADLPAPQGKEQWKRDTLNMWRGQAEHLQMCAHAVWNSTVNPEHLYKEIGDMLLRGIQLSEKDVPWTAKTVRVLADERARNLAEMFRGRILPEYLSAQKLRSDENA